MEKSSDIFDKISDDSRTELLKACGLPKKLEYNEDEVYLIRECQALINAGVTVKPAPIFNPFGDSIIFRN